MVKKILLWGLGLLLVLILAAAIYVAKYFGFILAELDEVPPVLPDKLAQPAVLVFSKANGYVHEDALPAGKRVLEQIARKNGWGYFETQNGAVMSPELLSQFKVVVWNNTSGTTLDAEQQQAFKQYLESGGGFIGIHAAGGDPWYSWDWYVEELIGAQFIGHTMKPQFQDADIAIIDKANAAVAHLPSPWSIPMEEWYAFASNPRDKAYTILLALDETSYLPGDATMPGEHPITWQHEIGQGRAFYTAIGHQGATYEIPEFQQLLENAIKWAGQIP